MKFHSYWGGADLSLDWWVRKSHPYCWSGSFCLYEYGTDLGLRRVVAR